MYAHSLSGRPKLEWQTLDLHLRSVAELAAGFADKFNSSDWARNTGLLHDLGKATHAFQRYLLKCNGIDDSDYDEDGSESNHASAGAAYAFDHLGLPGKIMAYLVAGHHAGLPDYHPNETGNAALTIRIEREGRKNLDTIREYAAEVAQHLCPKPMLPEYLKNKPENFHLWMRMLFSCLVDADRLNTEEFCDRDKHATRRSFPTVGKLAPLLFQALEKLERDAPKTTVNAIRAEIRRACETAAEQPPGLFSLTVPTGGGKTLSAMAFAMKHALKYGKQRVIYVIPYTSIIEQTAKTLGEIFGPENIVEHHSNIDPQKATPRAELASENWDAPIIVTTNVQFFESLYAAKPSRARKLHNIVNSVVILDEAHLLPPNLLTPCVNALNQLVAHYGVTLVLATATQPALPGLTKPVEIIPPEQNLYERLKRAEIHLPPDLNKRTDWGELASRLQEHKQVLCIVNTRRDCRDLFKLMPEGTIHLSALMCGAHRSEVIAEIKRRLAAGEPCRVVSTQLVEAGVDIDFPVVYRALAGLDSIAQAAGRCDREGKLKASGHHGQVCVFVPPRFAPPGLLRKGEDTMREMPALDGFDPQKPEFFARYFALFYGKLNDTAGNRFHELLVRDVNPELEIQFRTAAKEFRLIDDTAQQAVFVRWGDNGKWLDQLRAIGPTRDNLRALQRSCVNLSKGVFLAAQVAHNVEEIWPGYWLWIGKYDEVTGLDAFGEGFSPEEMIG